MDYQNPIAEINEFSIRFEDVLPTFRNPINQVIPNEMEVEFAAPEIPQDEVIPQKDQSR